MSDDFSITDNIVLQNAAIDASLRKMSMRHRPAETYREQKQSRVVFCTVMEKAPIPLVWNGNVIGGVFLKHKYPQRDCSLSRGAEVFRFDNEAEVKAFYNSYYQQYSDSDIYYCPECYPENYKGLNSSDTSEFKLLQAIKNGLRLAAILPPKPGYYFFQDKKVYPLSFDNGAVLNVRFFHPAGCQCQIMNDRSLYGPYKDASSALNSLDIGTEKNGVRNLPCPYCYADSAYKYHEYIKLLHKPVIDALQRYKDCPMGARPITETKRPRNSAPNTVNTESAAKKETLIADEFDSMTQSDFDTGKITILTVQANEIPSPKGNVSRFIVGAGLLLEEEPDGDPVVYATFDLRSPTAKNSWYYAEWEGPLHFKPEKSDEYAYYGINITFDMDEIVENGVYTPNLRIGSSRRHERCKLNEVVIKRKKKWSLF